ncbi:MAG: SRPBCC domain-containing protein [Myxococcota bacterium]
MTKSVVIERTFRAPIDRVWSMWTVSEHFASWYGPPGAKIPVANMDVQVGGKRHIKMVMQTPNGQMQMWFTGVYEEVFPTTRLVYTESMSDETGAVVSPQAMGMPEGHPETTRVIVQLEPSGEQTKMVLTHEGVAADSRGAMGWKMAIAKLEARLAE